MTRGSPCYRRGPAWLRFQVLAKRPIEMAIGTRIDYRLRVRGLPLGWTSEITEWEPGRRYRRDALARRFGLQR